MRRLVPRGIRLRLVLAISAVSVAAVAASFFALHETTAANLRSRIDRELNEQYAEFQQRVLSGGKVRDPASLRAASERFVAGQRYHPEARIYLVSPAGTRPCHQPEPDRRRGARREPPEAARAARPMPAASSPPGTGLTTISTDETGKLRVLTEPVVVAGTRIGTFRVADPLTSVDQALASLRNRFIAVGLGALLLSVAIAIWLANLISRPLRRMAAVASAVDSGDLSHRIDYAGRRRGRCAGRVLQPHAGSPRGGLPPAARLRLRRIARAAQPAHRAPGANRAAGRPRRRPPGRRGGGR